MTDEISTVKKKVQAEFESQVEALEEKHKREISQLEADRATDS